ncbi:MAG TPA: hypothetical protein VIA18_18570 [Polyangia bacterium]|jgi:tetratricopeptide (TPR) repeat protein|nr:hypothetical protein [Polyangia bacterium]
MKALLALSPLCLVVVGCAHYQMACPKAGGPAWIELTSPHFTLRTTLPADSAYELLREDEVVYDEQQAGAGFFFPDGAAGDRTTVVVFDRLWEYQAVVRPDQVGPGSGARELEVGRLAPNDERGRPMIALSVDTAAKWSLRYQLAQQLLRQRLHAPPMWLIVGLGEYFGVLAHQDDKLALGAGTPRLAQYNFSTGMGGITAVGGSHAFMGELPDVALFLKNEPFTAHNIDLRLAAWTLVHYLANGGSDYADRFRRFLAALADGQPTVAALVAEYGPVEGIDAAYRKHLNTMVKNEAMQYLVRYAPPSTTRTKFVSRPLDDAELHEMKALLRPSTSSAELAVAEQHAPQSPALHRWLALNADRAHDDATAEREMATAASLANGDRFYRYEALRVRFEHALARPPAEQHLEALADEMRAVAHFASQPAQLELIAHYYRLAGDATFAATFAARSVALDPQCARCLVTQAQIFIERGDQPSAIAALEAALRRAPDAPNDLGAAALLQKVKEIDCQTNHNCAK